MKYAKNKTTQRDFVLAWWKEKDRKAIEALKHDYPGIEAVSFFDGMPYADKLRNIPNNALRRAGLKPRRRNGERKKKAKLSQTAMMAMQTALNYAVFQVAEREIPKRYKYFAEFSSEAWDEVMKRAMEEPIKPTEPDPITYGEFLRRMDSGYKYDARIQTWIAEG